jgi:diguanylate cyclase (GGDEF)-like protein
VLALGWINANRLTRRLADREVKLTHELAERARDEAQQHQFAAYDQLTKLPNRKMMTTEFRKKIEETSRNRKSLATLLFDLDFFKEVNDLHGHDAGNELLTQVAERMSRVTRNYDLLSRIGGDEFVVVISGLEDRADVIQVVEKIIAVLEPPFELPGAIVRATTSVGISMYPEDGLDTSKLLRNADLAMHRAKAEGRNCYQFFNAELNLELQYSRWVETTLRDALEHNSLELQYQPQVNIDSGRIDSAEALVRWPRGDGESIHASDFIRNAERSGLISDVSHWVLQEVCRQQCEWREKGLENVRININLSRKDFGEKGVLYRFLQTLQHYNLRPEQVGIEIAENALKGSDGQLTKSLEMLHQSGVYISLDDFGAGISSLNDLRRLPLSGIKMDPSFVHEAPSSRFDMTIMQAITLAGHGFGLDVVVEGVESEWQETLCKDMGCTAIQGNHISEPLSADQFAQKHLRQAPH